MDRWGGWGSGVSWGRSESRSGYFGESWGDYLIDLSIFSDFGSLDLDLCVIGYFLFAFDNGWFVCLFQAICGWCLGVVCAVRGLWLCITIYPYSRAGFVPLLT